MAAIIATYNHCGHILDVIARFQTEQCVDDTFTAYLFAKRYFHIYRDEFIPPVIVVEDISEYLSTYRFQL